MNPGGYYPTPTNSNLRLPFRCFPLTYSPNSVWPICGVQRFGARNNLAARDALYGRHHNGASRVAVQGRVGTALDTSPPPPRRPTTSPPPSPPGRPTDAPHRRPRPGPPRHLAVARPPTAPSSSPPPGRPVRPPRLTAPAGPRIWAFGGVRGHFGFGRPRGPLLESRFLDVLRRSAPLWFWAPGSVGGRAPRGPLLES